MIPEVVDNPPQQQEGTNLDGLYLRQQKDHATHVRRLSLEGSESQRPLGKILPSRQLLSRTPYLPPSLSYPELLDKRRESARGH